MTQTQDTLLVVAGKVNAFLDKAAKADEYRISAGALLVEARRRVEAGEAGEGVLWTQWCRDNIDRSSRDIRKVMRLAGTVDPPAALAREREAAREGMALARERSNVRPLLQPSDVDPADRQEATGPWTSAA